VNQRQESRPLTIHDWHFEGVPESELVACCFYEFARESPSFNACYNEGKKVESYPGGLHYHARIGGILRTFPNPFVWAVWSGSAEPFFSRPWQDMDQAWRSEISKAYEGEERTKGLPLAFEDGDTQFMQADIISRGGQRGGIDDRNGRERIAIEIDWASFTDKEIADEFKKWVKGYRPLGIGRHSLKGQGKHNEYAAKLRRLGVMRLLNRMTLKEMEQSCPEAWKLYGPNHSQIRKETTDSHHRELYKMKMEACSDLHELYPFLPKEERPISHKSEHGVEM